MKAAIYSAPGSSGIARVFDRINRRTPVVLAFHGVTAEEPGHLCNYQGKHLYLPIFTRFMEYVRDRYNPVSLQRIVEWLEGGGEIPERAVAVTFDDGYADVLTNAEPVLSTLSIPATVFVVTDFVKGGEMVWTDRIVSALAATKKTHVAVAADARRIELDIRSDAEKAAADGTIRALCKSLPDARRVEILERIVEALDVGESEILSAWPDHGALRPEDLKTLLDRGIEVGSHTKSHKILTRCEPAEMQRELEESRSFIEGATGKPCEQFSYPNGGPDDFDARTERCARDSGYRCAATAIPTRVTRKHHPFKIPRYTLGHNEMTLAEFAAELSGYPDFLRGLRRTFTRQRRASSPDHMC